MSKYEQQKIDYLEDLIIGCGGAIVDDYRQWLIDNPEPSNVAQPEGDSRSAYPKLCEVRALIEFVRKNILYKDQDCIYLLPNDFKFEIIIAVEDYNKLRDMINKLNEHFA